MSKTIILVVLGMTFYFSTALQTTRNSSSASDNLFNEHAAEVLARRIAHTGLAEGVQSVFDSYEANGSYAGSSSIGGENGGGSYTVGITTSGTSFTLESVGQFAEAQHTLQRQYRWTGGVPAFLAGPILCDGNLHIDADLTLQSTDPDVNTNILANGNIRISEGISLINGFAYYGNNFDITNGQTAAEALQPNANPSGLPLYQLVPEVTMPELDPEQYAGIATQTSSDDLELSGSYALGTQDNPTIWYVDGDVKTIGPVQFSGYGVLVIKGSFHIEHNITTDVASESTLGLYVGNNIHIDDANLSMAGQWFADGNIHLRANTSFTGSMTAAGGNCDFDMPLNMTYRPASPVLTAPFWPSDTTGAGGTLRMLAARSW